MDIVETLEEIVGPDKVSTSDAVCEAHAYSCFLSLDWVTKPDIVVLAEKTEHVSEILKTANRFKVPVTAKGLAGGTGHGGPLHGGILLDLTHMDRITMIDTDNMKAVAEAGCSFFKLSQELFKKGMMLPTTEYGPGPNVAASAITPVNGFGKTRYGRNIDLVEGLEVVLPNGEIIRVGSLAYNDSDFGPFYRYITGPDLVGLFTQSNGAFGIVTKVAYQCLRRPPHWGFHTYGWPVEKIQEVTKILMTSTAMEVFDVHINDRRKYAGIEYSQGPILPEDCYFVVAYALNAESRQELDARAQIIDELCVENGGINLTGKIDTFFESWPTFFTPVCHPICEQLDDAARKISGSTYMYIYDSINYPISWFPAVYDKLREIGQKNGIWDFPWITAFDGFPMKSQTMCSQTWAFINTRDPDLKRRIYSCRDEFREWFAARGGTHQQHLPPVVPDYVWNNQSSAHALLKKIRGLLDPANILAPGTFY